MNTALFVDRLVTEWHKYNDAQMTELHIRIKVTYQNFLRTASFETTCILVFVPHNEVFKFAKTHGKLPILFRDFIHQKTPISNQEVGS